MVSPSFAAAHPERWDPDGEEENFELSDEQDLFRRSLRDFVERDIKPVAHEWEQSGRYPSEIIDTMKTMGLFGLLVPEEYGGMGADIVSFAIAFEEISRGWMGISGTIGSHSLACWMIVHHGTDEQRRRFLPDLATGRRRSGIGLTEPGAGSGDRPPGHHHPSRARRRSLRRQRHEDVDHERSPRRPSTGAEDRAWRRIPSSGHEHPPRRTGHPRFLGLPGPRQARLQGHRDL